MYTWLNYYIPDCDSTFISSCISASISSYLDDETDKETVIGELRGSLINCVFLPEHRGDLTCNLDCESCMGGEFAYFLSDLVEGKYNNIYNNISNHIEFGKVMWIDNFKIEPDYRGQGAGTSALKEFIEICKNVFSIDCIFLYPYPIDEESEDDSPEFIEAQKRLVKLYKKFGFEEFDAKFEDYENKLMFMLL